MLFEATSPQDFLLEEFNRRVRLNPRYSLRAFARSLGLSSGALSEILHRRRPITLKTATKLARALGLNATETKKLCDLVLADKGKAIAESDLPPVPSPAQRQLDEDTFVLVSEWYHFAILNLMDCEGFRWDARKIAKQLGLSVAQAQMAMNLLLRLGLVKQEGRNFKCAQDFVLSPSGVPSHAVRKFHRQILEKAILALELQSVDERDITGVGFAVDPRKLPQIKREIAEFQEQLVAKYSTGKRHDVYFLETALFRLTQGGRDEKK